MLGEWGIVFTILYEGTIALREYRSTRLFESIKYLEDNETRSARRIIYEKLVRVSPTAADWWDHDDELDRAASTVCARYNLVGAVSREDAKLREFIVKEWAFNICTTYEALNKYLRYREARENQAGAFMRYQELYEEARIARAMAVSASQNSNRGDALS